MGQLLKEFSDPVVWDFPREQIQNPVELGKYLKERYHDGSKGEKMAAVFLKVEEQQVPIATSIVHRRQYRTIARCCDPHPQDDRELESKGVVSKTPSPFNSPIWPVAKPDGEWRLTVDYRALNEVTPPLSAAVPDMLELQYELESKAAKVVRHN
ncbi:hypothetical protein DUI87_25066 [Hirundo rustica rustica]|uniref:Reverse transcriptase/retrotransposon-derived protein RNase H-like domain-containing protein n=1 Tax=Hirundo rustica rustica TaxID=333673 RepID=A0A3M0JCE9_HIRRU|nr:hypothetical protein DUI87_25066 [Hirundo rustica rustica]